MRPAVVGAGGGKLRRRPGDGEAIVWAIACCWIVVWGNYLLLDLGVTVFWLVPIDLFGVPALVTALFLPFRRRK